MKFSLNPLLHYIYILVQCSFQTVAGDAKREENKKNRSTTQPKEIRQRSKRKSSPVQRTQLHQFFLPNNPIMPFLFSFFSGFMPFPTSFTTTSASLVAAVDPVWANVSLCFPTLIALPVLLNTLMIWEREWPCTWGEADFESSAALLSSESGGEFSTSKDVSVVGI